MIAPILGGSLLVIDHTVPVYTSIVIFVISGVCVLLIKEREVQRGGPRIIAHLGPSPCIIGSRLQHTRTERSGSLY